MLYRLCTKTTPLRQDQNIAVVVPAYNEEKLIGLGMSFIPVIKTMPEYVDHIVVVDDCSQDRTAEVVRGYEDQLGERLVLLEHETNQGGALSPVPCNEYRECQD